MEGFLMEGLCQGRDAVFLVLYLIGFLLLDHFISWVILQGEIKFADQPAEEIGFVLIAGEIDMYEDRFTIGLALDDVFQTMDKATLARPPVARDQAAGGGAVLKGRRQFGWGYVRVGEKFCIQISLFGIEQIAPC